MQSTHKSLPNIRPYSDRWQCMIMLLYCLAQRGGVRRKRETISYIHNRRYFEISEQDLKPYPSQQEHVHPEPRWHTMIAYARKDCVLRGHMFDHEENDHWEVTRHGIEASERLLAQAREGKLDIRKCYLWSADFKKLFCPTYEPSERDSKRTPDLVQEVLRGLLP